MARRKRMLGRALALLGGAAIALTAVLAVFADGGALNVEVPDRHGYAADFTDDGAKVEYIGDLNTTFGSSGSGVFDAFVRLQAEPQEAGYNTDGDLEFNTKSGNFTHSILVSDIPVISVGGQPHWELWADINDSDNTPLISLNKLEIYFTDDKDLTGYPFGLTPVYAFSGSIHINDVNQGSGRGDLRYSVPLDGITIPTDCSYKNPACDTYFVLYSQWGAASGSYTSDGGFEEWKVKEYPFVTVSKTATTTFTRTFPWTIDKSVTPDTWDLFTNESGTSRYTVTLTKGAGVDSAWAVSGTITIENTSPDDAVINSVTDVISGVGSVTPSCGVSFPYILPEGDTLSCTYSSALSDGTGRTNTATVTLDYGGLFTGSAAITFGAPTTVVNNTVSVTDTYAGSLGTFSASGSTSYNRTFTCDGDEGTHNNTATITQTGQSDSASVDVDCYEINVTKDAATSLTRTFHWTIDKSVTPASWDMFTGDSGTSAYSVFVDKTGFTDSAWAVTGNIHVNNPNPIAATINSVSDAISGGITATVDCGAVTFPYVLAASSSLDCTYSAALPDGTARTNTATAVRQDHSYTYLLVSSDSGTTSKQGQAAVSFAAPVITSVNATINVTDTFAGALGSASDDRTFTYNRTFTCDADEGTHNNTATITQTGQNDSASVDVDCYEITVSKDADESFDRKYFWEINKTGSEEEITVPVDQTATVDYDVTVDVTGHTDSDWAVSGTITVHNPAPIAATINSVADSISGIGAVSVDCGTATFPYSLAAGGNLVCTYSSALPDASTRTNTATATRQNYDYASNGTATPDGTTARTGTASVNFAGATMTKIDECIDVSDTHAGALGTVCVGDTLPRTFHYERTVGPYSSCGDRTLNNTATFETNDTGTTGEDSWRVVVHVTGCGNLFHTGTTCDQYLGNDPPSGLAGQGIDQVNYSVRANLISQIDPGVFFYYTTVTAGGSSVTALVNQDPPGTYPNPMSIQNNNQVRVFDADCDVYDNFTFSIANGDVTVTINGTSAGNDYIISVKYDPKNLVGLPKPPTNSVTYDWETVVGGSSSNQDSLDLVKKQ